MTASSSSSGPAVSSGAKSKQQPLNASVSSPSTSQQHQQQQQQNSSYLSVGSSAVFQQVKQTQASLARLSRVHQQQQQLSQTNQSSHHQIKEPGQQNNVGQTKSTTFVDCLIRRFKDCFSEDFCTVPMFVVGNLSPGSDGTHLILPPCVSLGRQNISRFAGPKNLRLMNSIRESCRSIEELDLGGNKLNDLIEVYKILQCTPNLRFLNLSENDLSRTSPVAMAATFSPSTSSSSPIMSANTSAAHQNWSSSSTTLSHRNYLAPINQNQHAIGARRHSTLGQTVPGSSGGPRLASSRVAEARRLAAAAAVAQSKKTSSSVASKLTSSATAGASLSRPSTTMGTRTTVANGESQNGKAARSSMTASQRHQAATTSTMHLARSLSSLSAKDVRASSSSLGRLSAHRSSGRKDASLKSSTNQQQALGNVTSNRTQNSESNNPAGNKQQMMVNKSKLSGTHKLFVEPIAENEDIDMSEQQLSPGGSEVEPAVNTSNNNHDSHQQSTTTTQIQSRALALQTGIALAPKSTMCSANIGSTTSQSPNFRRTFESIKALALNNTGCQWRVVCSILSRMPNLEELHLSLNNYERIDLDPNEFKHHSLKRLYLCNNPKLTNWEELDKLLLAFPSLQALSIADCSISQIPENLDRSREWRKLCGLNINGWPIKEWPVIERLNQLPSLIDLKCRNLEILNTIDEPRHHLIARLPKLQRLNGSEIEEREHAEKAFLRFFMANTHLEKPSRFHELVQIHGEVIPVDVDVDLSPPSHAHVRVVYLNKNHNRNEDDLLMSEDFIIKLMDNVEPSVVQRQQHNSNNLENMEVGDVVASPSASSSSEITANDNESGGDNNNKLVRLFKDEGHEVLAIDVDLRQSVRKFKSTLADFFGLSSQNLILYYIDHEMVGLMGPELIKHNQKKLWNYNVQDGDQFIVEER